MRHTTSDIRCTELYSMTMTTKATFCQLPTTYCFPCIATLRLCKSLQFTKAATNNTPLV